MRNSSANAKVREEGGYGGAAGAGARISLQPMETATVEHIPTLQAMEDPTMEHVDIF